MNSRQSKFPHPFFKSGIYIFKTWRKRKDEGDIIFNTAFLKIYKCLFFRCDFICYFIRIYILFRPILIWALAYGWCVSVFYNGILLGMGFDKVINRLFE